VQHTASGVVCALSVVVVPVELRRNIDAQFIETDPTNIVKQVVICSEAKTRPAVETITLIAVRAVIAGHILELGTNTAAHGKVEPAKRVSRLWILFKNCDFRLSCERG